MRPARVHAALRAVQDTDEAPEVAVDEDGGPSNSVNSQLGRNFAGPSAFQQCMAFFKRVETGKATPSCVIDFAFSDGGRLKGDQRQMERCYCFHDPQTMPSDEFLVLVHAHTTDKWGDRKKQQPGRRLQRFTSVNVRHARIGNGAEFKQETSKFYVVPKNKELSKGWRNLPEKEIVWAPVGTTTMPPVPPVPVRDFSYTWMYEALGKVINAGEQLCMGAELAYSVAETQSIMRGGQEVEYEVVACTADGALQRGKVQWGGQRVIGLCIGVDVYTNEKPLRNAARDAETVNRELKAVPGCYSDVLKNPKKKIDVLRFLRKIAQEPGLKQKPPILVILYYAGHGVQHRSKVYLVPGDADIKDLEDLDTECVSLDDILQTLQKYWEEEIKKEHGTKQSIVFLIVPDSCRTFMGNAEERLVREVSQIELEAAKPKNAPSNYTIIYSCSRSTAASDGPQGGHSPFASAFLDKERGFFAEGISLTSAIAHVNSVLQKKGQEMHRHSKGDGLEDFCIRPKPVIQPNEDVTLGTPGAVGASRFCFWEHFPCVYEFWNDLALFSLRISRQQTFAC